MILIYYILEVYMIVYVIYNKEKNVKHIIINVNVII
jgi:hypothetical protein